MIKFKEDDYSDIYSTHHASLEEFGDVTADLGLLLNLQQDVFKNGWYVLKLIRIQVQFTLLGNSVNARVALAPTTGGERRGAIPNRAFVNALREHQGLKVATSDLDHNREDDLDINMKDGQDGHSDTDHSTQEIRATRYKCRGPELMDEEKSVTSSGSNTDWTQEVRARHKYRPQHIEEEQPVQSSDSDPEILSHSESEGDM